MTDMSQDLVKLSKEELKQFFNSFDHVLCDCDGVIFILFKPIQGVANALAKLENSGKSIAYVSNNTVITLQKFVNRLCACGLNATIENVVLPTAAIILYLKSIAFDRKLYIIGLSDMKKEFIDAGFKVSDYKPTGDLPEKSEVFVEAVKDDLDIGAVIFDYDPNMNYIRLQKAMIYAKRSDVLLISGCSDMEVPFGGELKLMGPGHFQKALEYMTKREFMKFGKPGKYLNSHVAECFSLNPQRTLFIGDSFSDMVFANDGGYQKLMVFTGNTKQEDIESCEDQALLPNYYLNSLGDISTLIDSLDQ